MDDLYKENDACVLKKSYCLYMDILGFKEKYKSAVEKEEEKEILNSINNCMNSAKLLASPMKINAGIKYAYKIFSDNIVIGFPVEKYDSDILFMIGLLASIIQSFFIGRNFFIRGSITYGNLHVGDTLVVGDALLQAIELEENVAVEPRIVLSPSIKKQIEDDNSMADNIDLKKVIKKDRDGNFIVNFLYMHEDIKYADGIEMYKNIGLKIINNLKENVNNPKIWNKYFWVASFYNNICIKHDEYKEFYIPNSIIGIKQTEI